MLQTNKNYFFIFIILFVLFEGIIFNIENNKLENDFKKNELRIQKVEVDLNNTEILAKAYSIYDLTLNRKIYGKNDDIPMPIASLAKIMSVVVALDNDIDEISISKDAIMQDGDFGIFENEKWKIDDLAKLTLVCSANDGAYAMIEQDKDYLNKMNSKAKRLGLYGATFLNGTGLDVNEHKAGAYATAEDVNQMAIYAVMAYPEIFKATSFSDISVRSKSGFLHNVKNTDISLNRIPNVIFSKTGFTKIAGGNLAIIFQDKMKHDIAITLLGSTFSGRFTDMEKIVSLLELSYVN